MKGEAEWRRGARAAIDANHEIGVRPARPSGVKRGASRLVASGKDQCAQMPSLSIAQGSCVSLRRHDPDQVRRVTGSPVSQRLRALPCRDAVILARLRDEVAVNPRRDRFGMLVRVGFMKEAVGVEEGRLHADRANEIARPAMPADSSANPGDGLKTTADYVRRPSPESWRGSLTGRLYIRVRTENLTLATILSLLECWSCPTAAILFWSLSAKM